MHNANDTNAGEEATEEPPILTPAEAAERAARRLDVQEREQVDDWPLPHDPLRQPGESSPAPDKRRRQGGHYGHGPGTM